MASLNRSLFLLFAIGAPLLCFSVSPGLAATAQPPNIILIVSSGHNAGVLGERETPNLFRMTQEGVNFTHAYCSMPIERTSRYSILTGRYPHSMGTTRRFFLLSEFEVTIADRLALNEDLPYTTCAIGNLVFEFMLRQKNLGRPLHGFTQWETWDDLMDDFQTDPTKWSPPRIPKEIKIQPPTAPFHGSPKTWLNSENLPIGAVTDVLPSTLAARHAVDYIQKHKERPFFLYVALPGPGAPFDYPIEFRGRHDANQVRLPELGPADEAQVPLIFRGLSEAEKRGIIAAEATAVAYVDTCVGIVLDGLRENGVDKNTLVIYTSDYGYMLGQHGRFEAQCFYEPAIRTPLVVRWPARFKPGRTIDALVQLIDLTPTIIEAAGWPAAQRLDGRSIMELLDGKTQRGRDFVFAEYLENEEAMVRTDAFKFIYSTGKRRREDGMENSQTLPGRTARLYDMQRDRAEFNDLAANPRYADQVKQMKQMMLDTLIASHPGGLGLPPDTSVEDQLDILLIPREIWKEIWDFVRSY